MADAKTTALTLLAAPSRDDLLYIVDDPSGSPVGKKGTIGTVLDLLTVTKSAFANRTSSNVTINGTSWANLDTGLDLVLSAVSGDRIEAGLNFSAGSGAVAAYFNIATIVSGSVVNTVVAAGSSDFGVQAWTCVASANSYHGGSIFYTLAGGDISSSTVTLRIRCRTLSATNKVIFATTDVPLQFWAKNHGH